MRFRVKFTVNGVLYPAFRELEAADHGAAVTEALRWLKNDHMIFGSMQGGIHILVMKSVTSCIVEPIPEQPVSE